MQVRRWPYIVDDNPPFRERASRPGTTKQRTSLMEQGSVRRQAPSSSAAAAIPRRPLTIAMREKHEICPTRVENPTVSALTRSREQNPNSRGSIPPLELAPRTGSTAVPQKQKALHMRAFPIARAGFEPATFGLRERPDRLTPPLHPHARSLGAPIRSRCSRRFESCPGPLAGPAITAPAWSARVISAPTNPTNGYLCDPY